MKRMGADFSFLSAKAEADVDGFSLRLVLFLGTRMKRVRIDGARGITDVFWNTDWRNWNNLKNRNVVRFVFLGLVIFFGTQIVEI